MRAMVLEQNQLIESAPLRSMEFPDPWPKDGEVRVRLLACAICRKDLHIVEGDLARKHFPIIPGHQGVGVVDIVGRGVQKLKVGDRVGMAWLRSTCGTCPFCTSGQENLCDSSRYNGYHHDGGFADYAVVPELSCYSIPKEMDPREAAPLLCAGILGYRALKKSAVPQGGTLGLFGFDSTAHLVFRLARQRGARILVIARSETHQALAKKMGADWVGSTAFDLPRKLDSAILFSPAGDLVPEALLGLRKGGTLALAGVYLSTIPNLDFEKHLANEKHIVSVTSNTRGDGLEFLHEAMAMKLRPHVSLYPLAEANRALQDLKEDRITGSGVLVM